MSELRILQRNDDRFYNQMKQQIIITFTVKEKMTDEQTQQIAEKVMALITEEVKSGCLQDNSDSKDLDLNASIF